MREAHARGEDLQLTEDERAFYDSLEACTVKVPGEDALSLIARELVATVRNNVAIDWTLRETARSVSRARQKESSKVRLRPC
jgi:type I restriction enzyme, R subunit